VPSLFLRVKKSGAARRFRRRPNWRRLRTGSPWADIPERFGPPTTCANRFRRWAKSFPYRDSNLVERFFNKLTHFRATAPRYEKHASNHLALVKLASIRIRLRHNESVT
jgi:transposase